MDLRRRPDRCPLASSMHRKIERDSVDTFYYLVGSEKAASCWDLGVFVCRQYCRLPGAGHQMLKCGGSDASQTARSRCTRRPVFARVFSQPIDLRHPLVRLAGLIDWGAFEDRFGPLDHPHLGRPGAPGQERGSGPRPPTLASCWCRRPSHNLRLILRHLARLLRALLLLLAAAPQAAKPAFHSAIRANQMAPALVRNYSPNRTDMAIPRTST